MKTNLTKGKILKIMHLFNEENPEPKIELNFRNNFTLLVAVVLSAQSTDKMVNICTEELFKKYDKPEDLIKLKEEGLIEYIKKIGLYRNKAKNVIQLSKDLVKNHSSKVPKTFEELIKLPGVGRKTADVVLNTAFNKPTIAVDRHIFRVAQKIGITNGKNVDEIADNLKMVIPKKYHKKVHHWLVLHGRYICKAQKQLCSKCKISKHCLYFNSKIEEHKRKLS